MSEPNLDMVRLMLADKAPGWETPVVLALHRGSSQAQALYAAARGELDMPGGEVPKHPTRPELCFQFGLKSAKAQSLLKAHAGGAGAIVAERIATGPAEWWFVEVTSRGLRFEAYQDGRLILRGEHPFEPSLASAI